MPTPHTVGVEHRRQRLEVTVRAGGDEGLGDVLVFGRARRSAGRGAGVGELRPGPARELTTRADGPADRLGDLVERHREHVVQHERHPLPRAQPAQHLEQRGAHLVVEGDAVGGVVRAGGRRRVVSGGRIVSSRARAERSWSRHSRPATTVSQPRTSSIAAFGSRQPQERLLRDVLGPPMSPSI